MKLRNKKTGEIVVFGGGIVDLNRIGCKNVAEMYEAGWEDYKEPKEYWFINSCGAVEVRTEEEQPAIADMHKRFGNRFETEEEAEKAAERLRAWKRLKDKGFRFMPEFHRIEEGDDERGNIILIACTMNDDKDFIYGDNKDLKLLFGGEE